MAGGVSAIAVGFASSSAAARNERAPMLTGLTTNSTGTNVEGTFSETVTGTESATAWLINGANPDSVTLDNSTTFTANMSSNPIRVTDTPTLSYEAGDIRNSEGDALENIFVREIKNTVGKVVSGYNGPSGNAPVLVLDFEEGIYAKDTGSGLTETTFDALITGGTVVMDEDGIRRLRCDSATSDAPTADITSLTLTAATIVVWYQSSTKTSGIERVFQFDDGTEINRIANWLGAGGAIRLQVRDTSTQQANINSTHTIGGFAARAASAWITNNFAISVNGIVAQTDSAGTVPTFKILRLGHAVGGIEQLEGGIQRIVIFDTRLSNADLATLSTNSLKFVDAVTGSDANDGSSGTPWATIDYAANNASAGDTVYITAGTYVPFEGTVSGTDLNNFFTLCAKPGDENLVLLDAGGDPGSPDQGGSIQAGVKFDGCNFLRLAGLRVINLTEQTAGGVKPSGFEILAGDKDGTNTIEHIRIVNCQTKDTRSAGIFIAGYRLSSHPTVLTTRVQNVRVEGCYIKDHNLQDGSNEGISVGGGVVNIQVKDNTVASARQYGIDFKAGVDGGEIVGNICENHANHGIYCDAGLWWVRNINIHKNICRGNSNGICVAREGGTTNPNHEIQNIDIYNNILYDNTNRGVLVYPHAKDVTGAGNGLFQSVYIRNNTIAGHTVGAAHGIRFGALDPIADDFQVTNNLLWDNTTAISIVGTTIAVNESNIIAASDPFTNIATGDFTLASGTADGVDDSNATYTPADDFNGTARPIGSADDAGAYESF